MYGTKTSTIYNSIPSLKNMVTVEEAFHFIKNGEEKKRKNKL
jgi:hypothetical protein